MLMGYDTGLQVWQLLDSAEAVEIISMRQGPVACATVLAQPHRATVAAGAVEKINDSRRQTHSSRWS